MLIVKHSQVTLLLFNKSYKYFILINFQVSLKLLNVCYKHPILNLVLSSYAFIITQVSTNGLVKLSIYYYTFVFTY